MITRAGPRQSEAARSRAPPVLKYHALVSGNGYRGWRVMQ
jgi:hypothetical protein